MRLDKWRRRRRLLTAKIEHENGAFSDVLQGRTANGHKETLKTISAGASGNCFQVSGSVTAEIQLIA